MWNSALIIAGYLLGEKWNVVESYVGMLQWVVLAAAVLAVVWFIVVKLRARRSPSENVQ